ncbi:MAG: hypothetical protein AB1439_08990 [candidate division FCPU426 bacterium]
MTPSTSGVAPVASARELEKYSSAFTLSDMEVFIFPELLYALVLANIRSPRIWAWRQDPWFASLDRLPFSRQLQRLKQYIMDHYRFNLDLETWGLTTKQRELARFRDFIDPQLLAQSNALFGYEGDRHYFDLDIRRHFGLDRYTEDIIPYWKTETVEAMDAFRHKPDFGQGAGECVSLSALYAAALYIVLQVPLEDIFLLATPLHSQNFVLREGGVITNNRRLVTKSMWFNGTELSTKARRALEKERITIVAHASGYAHVEYAEATIDPQQYRRFLGALGEFLTTAITFEIFINFLWVHDEFRRHFQFEYAVSGHLYYLEAERLFHYEHGSRYRIGDASRKKLLDEIDLEEYSREPYPGRYRLDVLAEKLNGEPLLCSAAESYRTLKHWLADLPDVDRLCERLRAFTCLKVSAPSPDKSYRPGSNFRLPAGLTRSEILERLEAARPSDPVVDLAYYAGRQVDSRGWPAFLKACLERNPVSRLLFAGRDPESVYRELRTWPLESIYDEAGLATPDEAANYRRGDGLELALCLANVIRGQDPEAPLRLRKTGATAQLRHGPRVFEFPAAKPQEVECDLPPQNQDH